MLTEFARLPPDALLRRRDIEAITGLPRSSIYDLVARGRFPSSIKVSARCVAWRWRDVQAWLADPTGYGADRAA